MDSVEVRRTIDRLSRLAVADLSTVMASIGSDDPEVVRRVLIEVMASLSSPYVQAASEVSASWYEESRAAAIGGAFYATTSGAVNQERLSSLVRWGVRPLAGMSQSTPLSLIGGGLSRIIANAARDTIDTNARADAQSGAVAATSWSRVARADACDFCKMLAGRGPVYRSAESAGAVIGRGVDPSATVGRAGGQGRGVRARGGQDLAAKFHDDCHCIAEPTFYRRERNFVTPSGKTFPTALVPIR